MRNLLLFIAFVFSTMIYAQPWLKKEHIGKQYPEFAVTTLNGREITHEQLKGKITLLNFWFSTCSPCIAEMDALEDIYNEYKDNPDFEVLSFSKDPIDITKESVEKYNIPYTVSSISDKESRRLNLNGGYPTTIITDREGKIIYCKRGGGTTKEMNFKLLEPAKQLIKESLAK
ncbi:MAG: peroxiredoxin family protein [Dysgonomonas sp.]